MKQALARILCIFAVLLLLNSIVVSFIYCNNNKPSNSKIRETEFSQKYENYSLLNNEIEEIDDLDDEDEKELSSLNYPLNSDLGIFHKRIYKTTIPHLYLTNKRSNYSLKIWLDTRKIII